MSSADLIVVLSQDGKVAEQGKFSDLCHAGGYIQELVAIQASNPSHSDGASVETVDEAASAAQQVKNRNIPAAQMEDKRRQLGDFTVYKYYFGSIGIALVSILIIIELMWAFFSTFPSKHGRMTLHCP
jgi:ATP-binding cassette, subfamily C (CFTR/MRP), member 1